MSSNPVRTCGQSQSSSNRTGSNFTITDILRILDRCVCQIPSDMEREVLANGQATTGLAGIATLEVRIVDTAAVDLSKGYQRGAIDCGCLGLPNAQGPISHWAGATQRKIDRSS